MTGPYAIAKEFSAGFCAAVRPEPISSKNEHWLAGYSAGYEFKDVKYEKLNEYLESIGVEKFGVVKLQENRE